MSVYVGIDVHRERSQVAVVTEDGKVQLNRNVVNGSAPMLRLIGGLPAQAATTVSETETPGSTPSGTLPLAVAQGAAPPGGSSLNERSLL